ncbi:MAG: hypothetical protein ACRDTJ_20635 [Pseudonocardiaceae bacterium]
MARPRELGGGAGGVGGQELVAPAVVLFQQGQLRAGVGLFAAADDAHIGWPAHQLVTTRSCSEQGGELDDAGFCGVSRLAVCVEDGAQADAGTRLMAVRSRAPSSQPME